jgi:hypothetical protein
MGYFGGAGQSAPLRAAGPPGRRPPKSNPGKCPAGQAVLAALYSERQLTTRFARGHRGSQRNGEKIPLNPVNPVKRKPFYKEPYHEAGQPPPHVELLVNIFPNEPLEKALLET